MMHLEVPLGRMTGSRTGSLLCSEVPEKSRFRTKPFGPESLLWCNVGIARDTPLMFPPAEVELSQ
jgi:hypothetical protein